MNEFLAVAVLLGFLLLFAGSWVAVCLLISRIGGWSGLAECYPAAGAPTGRVFRMQSASFGAGNYSGCLTITASPAGLHFSVIAPFRAGHRPIFLPTSAIRRPRVRKFLWNKWVEFETGETRLVKIKLGRKIFEAHRPLQESELREG